MTLRATFVGCSLLAIGCIPTSRAVILRSDARFEGGTETRAQVEVPGSWLQLSNTPHYPLTLGLNTDVAQYAEPVSVPARTQLIAPDNFTTVQLTLAPVTADAARCPELAHRAAVDATRLIDWVTVLGNERLVLTSQWRQPYSTDTKITAGATPDTVDYVLYVPGNVPGPTERTVIGRVVCRDGGLVTVGCSTGHLKTEALALCNDVVASLTLEHGPWVLPGGETPPPTASPELTPAANPIPETPNVVPVPKEEPVPAPNQAP